MSYKLSLFQSTALKRLFTPLLLSGFWLLLIAFVNPLGEFPLNDDWAFSKNVYYLVEQGTFKFSDWPAMTLIVQTLIGSLFCVIFGFSFTVLRFSTIFIGFLGIIFTYLLLTEVTNNKKMATFGTLLVTINPFFFSLSATFMTDVYFYTFEVLSFLFFFKYIKNKQLKYIVLATIFSIAATLIRQIGILFPLAFALSNISIKEINIKKIIFSGFPFILTITSLILYNIWFDLTQAGRPEYGTVGAIINKFKDIPNFLFVSFMRLGYFLTYIGFFLLPLLLILFKDKWTSLTKKNKIKTLIITIIFSYPIVSMWNRIPTGNIINNCSLGPRTLKDVFFHNLNNYTTISQTSWEIIVLIALISAVLLAFIIISSLINRKHSETDSEKKEYHLFQQISILFILLYIALLFLSDYYFDRYTLPFIPLILIIILPVINIKINKYLAVLSIVFTLIILSFSVLGTHDYLSWNRVRWEALNYLNNNKKISPHLIDGGFEYNGWYQPGKELENHENKISWWWVDKNDYIITFGPIEGYHNIILYPFNTYLSRKQQYIFVLQKDSLQNTN